MPAGTDRHRLRLAFEGVRDHGWFSPPGAGATATVKWSRTLPGKLGSNPAERRAGATLWLSSTPTRAAARSSAPRLSARTLAAPDRHKRTTARACGPAKTAAHRKT